MAQDDPAGDSGRIDDWSCSRGVLSHVSSGIFVENRTRFTLTATYSFVCHVSFPASFRSDAEQSQFEDRFDNEAATVLEAVRGSFYHSVGALDSFVVHLVAYAENSNSEWPFVTLPDYAVRGAKIRSESKAFYLGQYHLVKAGQRREWLEYSLTNSTWVDEGLQIQKGDANFHGIQIEDWEPFGQLFNNAGDNITGPGPFLPTWSSYPVVPLYPPFNWDAASYSPVTQSMEDLIEKRRVVLRVSNLADDDDLEEVAEVEVLNDWAKDYISETDDPSEPIIEIQYPISTDACKSVTQPKDPSPGSVVGILNASLYWRELLKNILPEGTGGITAVFEIGDRTFTYLIDGPNAVYLGRGDLHDTSYDSMERSALLLDLESATRRDHTYTGLPLSEDARSASIRIFPSAEMEDNFVSNDPYIYTVVTVLTFLFTSVLFIVYDRLRSNALKTVTNTAVRSIENAALLEEMVRQRTRELETTNRKLEEANRSVVRAAEAQLQHFACMSHEIRTPLVSCTCATDHQRRAWPFSIAFSILHLFFIASELRDWNVEPFGRQR